MLKPEFISRLSQCLVELPEDERQSTLEFYIEQIDDRIDDGMSEEAAVASLEAPEEIAANILAEREEVYVTPLVEKTRVAVKKPGRKWPLILVLVLTCWIWIPLLIAVIGTALGIYVALWGVLVGFFAAAVGFGLGFITMVGVGFSVLTTSVGAGISHFGAALGMLGLGIICGIIAVYGSKWLVIATKQIFISIKNFFAKKSRAELKQTQVQTITAQDGTVYEVTPVQEATALSSAAVVIIGILAVIGLFILGGMLNIRGRNVLSALFTLLVLAAVGFIVIVLWQHFITRKNRSNTLGQTGTEVLNKGVKNVNLAAQKVSDKVAGAVHNAATDVANATKPEDSPTPPQSSKQDSAGSSTDATDTSKNNNGKEA